MAPSPAASVLLVDRDPAVGREVRAFLVDRDYEVEWVDDDEKAFNRLDSRLFDVLVSELHIHRVDGMRLMSVARDRNPDVCVVFIAEKPDILKNRTAATYLRQDIQGKHATVTYRRPDGREMTAAMVLTKGLWKVSQPSQ